MSTAIITRRSVDSGEALLNLEIGHESAETSLTTARHSLAASPCGYGYVLFAGGFTHAHDPLDGDPDDTVDCYFISTGAHTTPTVLSSSRTGLAATSISSSYALFAGGTHLSYSDVVDAYNSSRVRSTPTALSETRTNLAAASISISYALFAGGKNNSSSSDVVDAYNSSLARSTPTVLSDAREALAATSNSGYALFGGGNNSTPSNVVDAYTSSLIRSTPTALSVARKNLSALSNSTYLIFGGGTSESEGEQLSDVVDAYNSSLARSTPITLSVPRDYLSACGSGSSTDKRAMFIGGRQNISLDTASNVVDLFDPNLVRTDCPNLSTGRYKCAAYWYSNKCYVAGGTNGSDIGSTEVYTLTQSVDVYPGSVYKYSGMSSETEVTKITGITFLLPGYIKVKSNTF